VSEQFCDVGRGITLCYEAFGEESDPTALLIMGLGTQMLAWQDDFCLELAGRGLHVVRFDNRDIGRSTHVQGRPPTIAQLLLRSKRAARYLLADMAQDAAGLLDELGLTPAHVIGASMGGMIAQTLAAHHPQSVRSLVSIMSSTGSRRSGQPSPRIYPIFLRRPPRQRDAFIAHMERLFTTIGSPGLPLDMDDIRALAGRSYDRDRDPSGSGRQLAAIIGSGDRTAELRSITAPTLVIHGSADPLVAPSGGRATARAIDGATLMSIEGMGHDLPRAIWPRLIDAIAEHAAAADALLESPPLPSVPTSLGEPRRRAAGYRRADPPPSACARWGTNCGAAAPAPASDGRGGNERGGTASGRAARGASAPHGTRTPSSPSDPDHHPMHAWHPPSGSHTHKARWPNRPTGLLKFCRNETAIRRRLKISGRRCPVSDRPHPYTPWSRILLDLKPIFKALP